MMLRKLTLGLSLLISSFITVQLRAQIFLNLDDEPTTGVMVELAPEGGSATPKKNMSMQHVELRDLTKLQMGTDPEIMGAERLKNIGLMVNNTIKRETADRICPGMHMWTGESWEAIKPYPNFGAKSGSGAPEPDLVDPRDGEIYHTARFHSVSVSGNPYTCNHNATVVIKEIDAGVWMTQNLRTTTMPDGTPLAHHKMLAGSDANSYVEMQYANTQRADVDSAQIHLNGKLYNWAAATYQKGNGTSGRGNVDNLDESGLASDEGVLEKGIQIRRQGICPDGWHLPSIVEWRELGEAIRGQSALYSTMASAEDDTFGNAMKVQGEGLEGNIGASNPADKAGFNAYMVGSALTGARIQYGITTFFWSSSSKSFSTSWSGNLRDIHGGFYYVDDSVRDNLYSVRCKKD